MNLQWWDFPLVVTLAGAAVVVPLTSAQAAIWQSGCQGQLGEQQVIFNSVSPGQSGQGSMVIVDTKAKMGDVRELPIELPPGALPSVNYEPEADYRGFEEKTMVFTRAGDAKLKLTLTEKSSKRISHKHRLAGCLRDETTDVYRKTFSLQRENEAPRDITMQCVDYQLSTSGGRWNAATGRCTPYTLRGVVGFTVSMR